MHWVWGVGLGGRAATALHSTRQAIARQACHGPPNCTGRAVCLPQIRCCTPPPPAAVNGASSVFDWHQGSRFRLMLAQVAGEAGQGGRCRPCSLALLAP